MKTSIDGLLLHTVTKCTTQNKNSILLNLVLFCNFRPPAIGSITFMFNISGYCTDNYLSYILEKTSDHAKEMDPMATPVDGNYILVRAGTQMKVKDSSQFPLEMASCFLLQLEKMDLSRIIATRTTSTTTRSWTDTLTIKQELSN